VMEHPPHGEHHQSLAALETVFHQLGHRNPPIGSVEYIM
jgi:hypothetical protein